MHHLISKYRAYKDYIENVLGLAIIFVVILVGAKYFDLETLKLQIASAGLWAGTILVFAKAATIVFAPLSGSPLYPLAGALFGFTWGSIYLVLGDILGAVISFYLSRVFGKKFIERFVRGNMPIVDKIIAFMETTKGFLIARVCFVALPEAVSYAAGLTRIRFWTFIIIQTLVGLVPTLILAGAGSWVTATTGALSVTVLLVAGFVIAAAGGVLFVRLSQKQDQVLVQTDSQNTVNVSPKEQ